MEINLSKIFKSMVERGASDLFLRGGATPRVRVNGKIEVLDDNRLTRANLVAITASLIEHKENREEFAKNLGMDFIHEEPGLGRFRINIFMQRTSPALVARYVHEQVKSFEELNLPGDLLEMLCAETKGLFLCCGPAGNGKSTSIASMLDFINERQAKHIVTIEDPIEYLFKDKLSLINQRELGIDVYSYPEALRDVTQQSPDIIYIGNIRDEATMKAAVTATELGSYVISTLHTVNAVQTIIRIINFFPPHFHEDVRMQLSLVLRGTMSLRLIPKKDGSGRVPALETMIVTPTIARLIREGRIREIQNFIDEGELFGMTSFKKSLVNLVKSDLIDEGVARRFSDSKDDFDLEMKGLKRSL
ncbi:type IV pilus twitching motility protein PilT [Candidatus Omnitrophota bacterium]